jgi:hypothetical protein
MPGSTWNHMNEINEVVHVPFPWQSIIGTLVAAAFGAWAWVVKKFGEQHIESVKSLSTELREMRRDINSLAERMRVVEVVQKHYHPE